MEAGKDYRIVPFDPSLHTSFVFGTFKESLLTGRGAQYPWKLIPWRLTIDRLKKLLRSPSTKILVAVDGSEIPVPIGWAAVTPADNEVIFAYVGYEKRQLRVGTGLLTAAGIDLDKPVGLLFWSRAAQRISRKPKYKLFFRVTDTAETPVAAPPVDPEQYTQAQTVPPAPKVKRKAA